MIVSPVTPSSRHSLLPKLFILSNIYGVNRDFGTSTSKSFICYRSLFNISKQLYRDNLYREALGSSLESYFCGLRKLPSLIMFPWIPESTKPKWQHRRTLMDKLVVHQSISDLRLVKLFFRCDSISSIIA